MLPAQGSTSPWLLAQPTSPLCPSPPLPRYGSEADEGFFGFGQQYSRWDLKGSKVPVIISEQGVGRGLQPLTFLLNTLVHGIGSYWHTTYVAKPMYMTSHLRALSLENPQVCTFMYLHSKRWPRPLLPTPPSPLSR